MPNYPKGKKTTTRRKKAAKKSKADEALLELELFEEWKRQILPELREMLLNGATADDIFKSYQAHAAARAVTIAITEADSNKALSASKEIVDRASGKSVERRKIQHELKDLDDEKLDALILSEMEDYEEDEEDEKMQ